MGLRVASLQSCSEWSVDSAEKTFSAGTFAVSMVSLSVALNADLVLLHSCILPSCGAHNFGCVLCSHDRQYSLFPALYTITPRHIVYRTIDRRRRMPGSSVVPFVLPRTKVPVILGRPISFFFAQIFSVLPSRQLPNQAPCCLVCRRTIPFVIWICSSSRLKVNFSSTRAKRSRSSCPFRHCPSASPPAPCLLPSPSSSSLLVPGLALAFPPLFSASLASLVYPTNTPH